MYLGPIGKPDHKAECQCEQCCQWMVDEIDRLNTKIERLQVIADAVGQLDGLEVRGQMVVDKPKFHALHVAWSQWKAAQAAGAKP